MTEANEGPTTDKISEHDRLRAPRRDDLRQILQDAAAEVLLRDQPLDEEHRFQLLEQALGEDLCRQLAIYRLPADLLLSVVIPVYNEVHTIVDVVQRVRDVGLPCEMILVDDGSTDGTRDRLSQFDEQPNVRVVLHTSNQGKGAAVRTGFQQAAGDVIVIQDADAEYDPRDFRWLLQPIVEGQADVVYGSRFTSTDRHVSEWWHRGGNQVITWLSNLSTQRTFSDVETCYKMFRRDALLSILPQLRENGFGIELEITARLARRKDIRFYERPISYQRRGYGDGKKIGWRDALWAVWCILRY